MESLFMEAESAMNLRRSSFSSALSNNHSNLYGGFGFKSSQNAYNYSLHHPSVGSASQLLVNTSNNMMVAPAPALASFRGGYIPATSPISLYSPIPLRHHQPPLLPLPMKSATMPSSTKKITMPPSAIRRSSSTAARQSNQKRKKKQQQQQQAKPSTSPKEEPAAEEAPKAMENKARIIAAKKEEEEEETEEEFLIGSATTSKSVVSSVYSLSPPPSSLPLPRLLLMRPRRSAKVAAVASSCIAEAMAGVDAGATDDLRKLLRL